MASLLLPVIYLAFISLGLPDSLLGSAWPSMVGELGANLSWAGIVSMIISAFTIVSSLCSERLNARFGTGGVTAGSVLLTAAALLGFSSCTRFWQLCPCAAPYGLGAGSVDAALNAYVSLHYESRHMSWLHCMWGVGASIGPVIMGQALAGGSWQGGYRIISVLQFALTLILFFSLPLWKRTGKAKDGEDFTPEHRSIPQLLRLPGVPQVLLCFFCYCALEATAGMWAASYCTLVRGIDANTAANWTSTFYLGITIGRGICGFLTMKITDQNMIRLGQGVIALGVLLVLLPAGQTVLFAGLVAIGLGCAPVYPCIIHETPANFGRSLSLAMTGIQMAFAYVGSCLMPPLFGLLAQCVSPALYPWYLGVLLVVMFVMAESLHRRTRDKREAVQAGE